MKIFLLLVAFLFSFQSLDDSAIKMEMPDGWVEFQKSNVLETIHKKWNLSAEVKDQILKNNKSSVFIFGYTTPVSKGKAYRPNIQALLRPSGAKNITDLKMAITKSFGGISAAFEEVKVIEPIQIKKLGNVESVYVKFSAKRKNTDGSYAPFISRIYSIPNGNTFIQLNLSDAPDFDCEKDFANALATFKLEKE